MSAVVTVAEMRSVEEQAVRDGLPLSELMRQAGQAVAAWVDSHVRRQSQRRVVALVGQGNNGNDALVALALLHERGWQCSAIPLNRSESPELPVNRSSLSSIEATGVESLEYADLILDGIFGIGGRAELSNDIAGVITAAHRVRIKRRTPLVAIDVPSGVDASSGSVSSRAFRADVTLCLGLVKRGLLLEPAASAVGELVLLPLGLERATSGRQEQMITEGAIRPLVPVRRATAHKSDTGTALIIGGAEQYYGAPRLAGAAAMRAGAGLVAIAAPKTIIPVIAAQIPEAVFVPLDDDPESRIDSIEAFIAQRGDTVRSVVAGPGIGRSDGSDAVMHHVFGPDSQSKIWELDPPPAIVIDADGLNWLSQHRDWHTCLRPQTTILTPHAGEMTRLLGVGHEEIARDPFAVSRAGAMKWNQVVVLKAGVTSVALPDGSVHIAPRATPELATAGTGDVLAGLIGGLLSQGVALSDAAQSAVWIGAMAALGARQQQSIHSVVATDVISNIAGVLDKLASPLWSSA